MKCICSGCFTILSINIETLRKLKHSAFKCLKCESIIKLKPNIAKCGNCKSEIRYHKYQFEASHPYTKCKACDRVNKVSIKY